MRPPPVWTDAELDAMVWAVAVTAALCTVLLTVWHGPVGGGVLLVLFTGQAVRYYRRAFPRRPRHRRRGDVLPR